MNFSLPIFVFGITKNHENIHYLYHQQERTTQRDVSMQEEREDDADAWTNVLG